MQRATRTLRTAGTILLMAAGLVLAGGCSTAPLTPPRDAPSWYEEGISLAKKGQTREAVYCLKEAVTVDPSFARGWRERGILLRLLDKHDEAIQCLDRAIGLDPADGAAWCQKGITLSDMENPDKALGCFDRALRINPQDTCALKQKGRVLLESLGKAEDAVRYFERARQLDARDTEVWNSIFTIHLILKNNREAWLCYTQARRAGIRLEPQLVKTLRENHPALENPTEGLDPVDQ